MEYVVSGCLFVKLVIGLPLNMMVIFYSIQTFSYTKDIFPLGTWKNKVMRLSVVAVAVSGLGSVVAVVPVGVAGGVSGAGSIVYFCSWFTR